MIWLVDQLGKGGPDYAYRIEVTPVQPNLVMTTNAEQIPLGSGVIALAVPKGNRQAILIYGNRADFGGDLNVATTGLPAGVSVEAPVMVASQGVVPVLFTAKADAPLAAKLADVSGKPVDAKLVVPSEFVQETVLVYGQNNVNVWSRKVDKLAVSVTDECPYMIEVVEPKVPLVLAGLDGLEGLPGWRCPSRRPGEPRSRPARRPARCRPRAAARSGPAPSASAGPRRCRHRRRAPCARSRSR